VRLGFDGGRQRGARHTGHRVGLREGVWSESIVDTVG
jgi:hypothetical protein